MDSDMMKNIPEDMVKIDERKLIKHGPSYSITLPPSPLRDAEVCTGDTISLYSNGKGLLLIDLKPDKD